MTILEVISLLTVICGLITVTNFSLKLLENYKELVRNEINLKRDVNHALKNTEQIEINLEAVIKQFDDRLHTIEKELIKIQSKLTKS